MARLAAHNEHLEAQAAAAKSGASATEAAQGSPTGNKENSAAGGGRHAGLRVAVLADSSKAVSMPPPRLDL